ncbi:thioesterase [Spirochaetia bacterium]|nr:thioesterase [Spirochaetia bacterium]
MICYYIDMECTFTVRTYECDSYGHVNNANYLNYLEYGRYEFLKSIDLNYEALVAAGFGIYIARIEIDYKKPAFPDETLIIRSWPEKKGAVSGTLAQQIWRGEDLIIDAHVTWAFVTARGSPVKIPPEWNKPGLFPAS